MDSTIQIEDHHKVYSSHQHKRVKGVRATTEFTIEFLIIAFVTKLMNRAVFDCVRIVPVILSLASCHRSCTVHLGGHNKKDEAYQIRHIFHFMSC